MSILVAHEVSKRFGGVVALAGVSFHVEPGEIVGVVGPNGAGKTTLFDIIAGLQAPTSGYVEYDGRRITGLAAHRIARLGLARTFQIPRLFVRLDVLQNVLVGAYTSGLGRHEARRLPSIAWRGSGWPSGPGCRPNDSTWPTDGGWRSPRTERRRTTTRPSTSSVVATSTAGWSLSGG